MSGRISNNFGKVARIFCNSLRSDNGASISKFCLLFSTVKVEETEAVITILVECPLTACENDRTGLIGVDLNDLGRLFVVDGNCPCLICCFENSGLVASWREHPEF
ncbi:hypothetical protein CDAR_111781 [Caerostris darwini]|uniref:Uncharacterized protein n=1 Tax=Caerostris darwini TaxID=1538125 RepID=A0AAV4S5Y6_9ARAC|nr:hypothetical protein CDAR_111781 [Caerostris darwini]